MIEIALLIGVATIAIATFWDDIVNWLQKAISAVKKTIQGILFGVKVFVKKIGEAVQEIGKYYSKSGTQWTVTTETKTLPASEVPADIRAKAEYQNEVDITDEVSNQLKMAL